MPEVILGLSVATKRRGIELCRGPTRDLWKWVSSSVEQGNAVWPRPVWPFVGRFDLPALCAAKLYVVF